MKHVEWADPRAESLRGVRDPRGSASGPGAAGDCSRAQGAAIAVLGTALWLVFAFFVVTGLSPPEMLFGVSLLGRGDIVFASPVGVLVVAALCAALAMTVLTVSAALLRALWAAIRAFAGSILDHLVPNTA